MLEKNGKLACEKWPEGREHLFTFVNWHEVTIH